jgi:hypothetical protein
VNYTQLITALIAVESGGDNLAEGDHGKARGPLQIHECVVRDVNAEYGTHYTWKGMTNRTDARRVCDLYLQKWAKGRSVEEAARIWNGGPKGHTKDVTKAYWRRVQSHLDRNNTIAKN